MFNVIHRHEGQEGFRSWIKAFVFDSGIQSTSSRWLPEPGAS